MNGRVNYDQFFFADVIISGFVYFQFTMFVKEHSTNYLELVYCNTLCKKASLLKPQGRACARPWQLSLTSYPAKAYPIASSWLCSRAADVR